MYDEHIYNSCIWVISTFDHWIVFLSKDGSKNWVILLSWFLRYFYGCVLLVVILNSEISGVIRGFYSNNAIFADRFRWYINDGIVSSACRALLEYSIILFIFFIFSAVFAGFMYWYFTRIFDLSTKKLKFRESWLFCKLFPWHKPLQKLFGISRKMTIFLKCPSELQNKAIHDGIESTLILNSLHQ